MSKRAEEVLRRLATAEGEGRLHAEVAYYHWLLDGMLRGIGGRAALRGDHVEHRVMEESREILDDLMTKVHNICEREEATDGRSDRDPVG